MGLTRKDVLSLLSALKDLNERTMAIQRLPDGRTAIGGIIVGSLPSQKELADALQSFTTGNFAEALRLFQKAVDTIELNQNQNHNIFEAVSMSPEAIAEIYALAAQSAQQLGSNYFANELALKSVSANATPRTKILSVTTLHNLAHDYLQSNDFSNAFKLDQKAIRTYESVERSVSTNFLRRQDALKLYANGLQSASRLGRTNEANELLEKGQKISHEITDLH